MKTRRTDRLKSHPLRISYVFQQYPVATEVFATSDMLALIAEGHKVRAFVMKPAARKDRAFLEICGVPPGLSISRPSVAGACKWPALCWRHRRVVARLVRRALLAAVTGPSTAASAVLSIPRALEIAEELEGEADVAHVFWSRHGGMVLVTLESFDSLCIRSAFVGAYDLVADDFLVDVSLESADTVFSHAEVNRAYVQARAAKASSVHIVRRGIPLTALAAVTRDRFRWITASALTPAKNVEGVVRTFTRSLTAEPRLRLTICGDGPDRGRIERLTAELGVAEAVDFTGHIRRDDLFRQMERCGLFLFLSKKESERLPNVLKEALWAGCAVICSHTDGIEELIPDSTIGYVVDADDHGAIAKAVSRVLAEDEAAAEIRRARARRFVQEQFSTDRSMAQYVEAWRAKLQSRQSARGNQRALVVGEDE